MDFKTWLKEKTIGIITKEDLNDMSENDVQYMATNKDILENIYNLYKDTNILDFTDIYILKHERFDYVLVFTNELIDSYNIFETTKFLNSNKTFKNINMESLKALFINDIEDYDDFYVLLTLDPNIYKLDYVKKIEKLLNKTITKFTNLDLLYKEFKNLLNSDIESRLIIQTNMANFGIIAFNSLEEYNNYIDDRDEFFSNIQKSLINNIQNILPDNMDIHSFNSLKDTKEFMQQIEEEDDDTLLN